MSYKSKRDYLLKLPNYLVWILAGIIVFGLIIGLIGIYYPNPLFETVSTKIASDSQTIMDLVIGAMIASIIGLLSSIVLMDLNMERERDNVILGFYYDLKFIRDKIQNIPAEDLQKCTWWLHVEKEPLYYDNGLYFVFRKEIFLLDHDITEKLIKVYSKIIFLEEQRKNLLLEKPRINPETPKILIQLKDEITDLFEILETEKKKIDS
jgi:hypothetical protein